MVGALLCVVAAEGPILDLSNSAHQRGASTISLPQPPDDTPIGSEGSSFSRHCASQERLGGRASPCPRGPQLLTVDSVPVVWDGRIATVQGGQTDVPTGFRHTCC